MLNQKVFGLLLYATLSYAWSNSTLISSNGTILATCNSPNEDELLTDIFPPKEKQYTSTDLTLLYNITCEENTCNYKNICAPDWITYRMEQYCENKINGVFNDEINKKCLEENVHPVDNGVPCDELHPCKSNYCHPIKEGLDENGNIPVSVCQDLPYKNGICCLRMDPTGIITRIHEDECTYIESNIKKYYTAECLVDNK